MARAILIALVIAVVVAIFLPRSGQRADGDKVPAEVRSQLRGHKVVMLSASWCGYCKTLRNDLRAAKVPFKVLDIEETATGRKVADALNVQAVPVTIVDDDVVYGYDPDEVIALAKD